MKLQMTSETLNQITSKAECLYDIHAVENALDAMAGAMGAELSGVNPILLCVMNGGLVPTGKLLTRLDFQLELDYLHISRYRNTTQGSDLRWISKPHIDINNRVVLIVDDILDEGLTLKAVRDYCISHGAKKAYTAVLVDKIHARKTGVKKADFVGLDVEDRYVYGCGMDYKGYLRNAPGIFAVQDSDAS